ncbi:LLM class flavin-dependent oxidoreductase [Roseovarius pelagicus]|uniref:LLM class flavin-dependent oxidoreductase n=1 Tax=Roseovarius pelagicus TaxID=2980108 RepID=A0ABY6DCE4_9RHOB|nr:LLM class flavin-dependent oxidoreductase [Roseovarius pelagicus]UXX81515.1 LLM class flavin-dependent oxidoreductase [Roseovarius pelagicus]
MDFNHFLSSYLPDPSYGGRKMYQNMIDQAVHADNLGYKGVSIPEHHLINILLVPAPLQLAVRIASLTKHVKLVTSICVLPLHDMRIFAGEIIQAQALCDDRLVVGVGRGAFGYELGRLDRDISQSREVFDESLQVLEKLLAEEEVSWNGTHYNFEPLTVMPRPEGKIPLMLAVMAPGGIEAVAGKGYLVQTTPLAADDAVLLDQVNAFKRGEEKARAAGKETSLSLQRSIFLVRNAAEKQRMLEKAADYYDRFDNVFTGPGIVQNGQIEPIRKNRSMEDLSRSLLICERDEMIDRLGFYAETGIDEIIMSCGFGQTHQETLDMMQYFAEDVMRHFSQPIATSVA